MKSFGKEIKTWDSSALKENGFVKLQKNIRLLQGQRRKKPTSRLMGGREGQTNLFQIWGNIVES